MNAIKNTTANGQTTVENINIRLDNACLVQCADGKTAIAPMRQTFCQVEYELYNTATSETEYTQFMHPSEASRLNAELRKSGSQCRWITPVIE